MSFCKMRPCDHQGNTTPKSVLCCLTIVVTQLFRLCDPTLVANPCPHIFHALFTKRHAQEVDDLEWWFCEIGHGRQEATSRNAAAAAQSVHCTEPQRSAHCPTEPWQIESVLTDPGALGTVAAHPRKPLVSETKGLRGWAATLPRAPALGFF